jgi:hypothetical protein
MPVPLSEQIECVEREIRMRNKVYPRWVEAGRMSKAKARDEQAAMEAVLATLKALPDPGRLL